MSKFSREEVRVAIEAANEGSGAALDAILRDDGGGLVFPPVDTFFRDAICAVETGSGEALAAILRSDYPIGRGERELLAQLTEGRASEPGKRARAPFYLQRWAALFYIEQRERKVLGKNIIADLEPLVGVKKSMILEWVNEFREFEEANPTIADRHRADVRRTVEANWFPALQFIISINRP